MQDQKKMKVLMASYTSYLQEYYQSLPKEIVKQSNAELKLLVPPYWKELWAKKKNVLEKKFDKDYDIQVGKIFFSGNLHFALFRSKLKELLKNFKPDIIDMEDEPFNLGSLQIAIYRKKYSPDSKLILHASQNRFKSYPFPFNWIEQYVLKNIDGVLVRNKQAGEVLRQKGFKGKIELVTHGVSIEAFFPRERNENCKNLNPENKFLVGYVGVLLPHKGLSTLIRAAAQLDCRVMIVGEGDEKESLQNLAEELNADVIFTSSATHDEVAQLMNCMDTFVLPSRTKPNWTEKFGRVLIEAMASELAVIGSSSGEIPNVIGDCGLVFQEDSVEDLKEKIQTLMDNPELRKDFGKRARKRVEENFSTTIIGKKTIAAYRDLLNS